MSRVMVAASPSVRGHASDAMTGRSRKDREREKEREDALWNAGEVEVRFNSPSS